MDASTIDTPVDATVTTYRSNDELQAEIVSLRSNLESMTKNWEWQREQASKMLGQIREFSGYLKEHVEDQSIDLDIAQTYAEIFDIVLTKKYDVSVTVTFSGTAEVPLGMDEDSITSNVSFSFDEGWSDGVEWDMTEDNVDWDIQEAY